MGPSACDSGQGITLSLRKGIVGIPLFLFPLAMPQHGHRQRLKLLIRQAPVCKSAFVVRCAGQREDSTSPKRCKYAKRILPGQTGSRVQKPHLPTTPFIPTRSAKRLSLFIAVTFAQSHHRSRSRFVNSRPVYAAPSLRIRRCAGWALH